jgi:hypothetical protein
MNANLNTNTNTSVAANSNVNTNATVDPTAGWKTFKSTKFNFGYTLSYPSTYTVNENVDGGLVIKSADGYDMFELFTSETNQNQLVSIYKDSAQGYMTGTKQSAVTIAGVTGIRLDGQFGKNAGIEIDHSSINGSSIIFTKNSTVFVFNAYDNGDQSAIFSQMIQKLTF